MKKAQRIVTGKECLKCRSVRKNNDKGYCCSKNDGYVVASTYLNGKPREDGQITEYPNIPCPEPQR